MVFRNSFRFYSGYHACQLYSLVANLDIGKEYVKRHKIDTRKQAPVQQCERLTGQSAASRKDARR